MVLYGFYIEIVYRDVLNVYEISAILYGSNGCSLSTSNGDFEEMINDIYEKVKQKLEDFA